MIVPSVLLAFSAATFAAGPVSTGASVAGKDAGPVSAPVGPAAQPALATPADPPALVPAAGAVPAEAVDPLHAAPAQLREVVEWINGSGDNTRLPFLVIDKPSARVFAFDASGQYQGDAPVLLGMGLGDRMLAPSATMSQMPPHTRITPAGRFVSKLAKDAKGKELLVLDYKAALSLHPVVKGKPHERRAERLASVTPDDNRISFGCINVPVPFYENVVSRAFANTHGIVYILPETSLASAMFRYEPAKVGPVGALASRPAVAAPVLEGPAATGVSEASAK